VNELFIALPRQRPKPPAVDLASPVRRRARSSSRFPRRRGREPGLYSEPRVRLSVVPRRLGECSQLIFRYRPLDGQWNCCRRVTKKRIERGERFKRVSTGRSCIIDEPLPFVGRGSAPSVDESERGTSRGPSWSQPYVPRLEPLAYDPIPPTARSNPRLENAVEQSKELERCFNDGDWMKPHRLTGAPVLIEIPTQVRVGRGRLHLRQQTVRFGPNQPIRRPADPPTFNCFELA